MDLNAFDMSEIEEAKAKYQEEARERWGGTDAWKQSQEKAASYGKADWASAAPDAIQPRPASRQAVKSKRSAMRDPDSTNKRSRSERGADSVLPTTRHRSTEFSTTISPNVPDKQRDPDNFLPTGFPRCAGTDHPLAYDRRFPPRLRCLSLRPHQPPVRLPSFLPASFLETAAPANSLD